VTGRSLENLSILVLDDDPLMCALIRGMLHALDASYVVEAVDATQARAELDRMAPDVVLCNDTLPADGALAFVRWLRGRGTDPVSSLPVVLLLDRARMDRVAEAREAGVTEFLLKPVSLRALHDHVCRAVEMGQPFVRTPAYFGPDRRRETDVPTRFGVTLSEEEVKVLLGG
jgi:CheY-like chemotaxis protein